MIYNSNDSFLSDDLLTTKYETSFKNHSIDILFQIEMNFLFLIILNLLKKGLIAKIIKKYLNKVKGYDESKNENLLKIYMIKIVKVI